MEDNNNEVARLKPAEAVNSAHGYTDAPDELSTITAGQINHECQKHNDELVKQLSDAQARVKELEQDNAEGFEKYQELLVVNRNLKERVKELEDLIKSDVVHSLLRFGYKNPCSSGCDNFEGSENVDLYNISNELRNK